MSDRIDDGFSTIYTFSANGAVAFYERETTPPGVDGGGANDTTNMRNTEWRTRAPKKLKTLSDAGTTVMWKSEAFEDVVDMVNVNQLITLTFPDGSTLAFWGWLNKFTPNAHKEGEVATAMVEIIPSNQNGSGVETGPVYTDAA